MAGGRSATETSARGRGSGPSLAPRLVLGTGLLVGSLSGLVVLSGTSTIGRQAFASMRQQGVGLARIVALAAGAAQGPLEADGLKAILDRVAVEGSLVYAGIVDRDGAVLAETGPSGARPIYASRSLPMAPAERQDRVTGLAGEPLYLFTFPVVLRGSPPAPPEIAMSAGRSPLADEPGQAGLGPRAAGAAARRGSAGADAHRSPAVVQVAFAAAPVDDARRAFAWQGSLLGLAATLGAMLLMHVQLRLYVLRPSEDLASAAADLAAGRFGRRSAAGGAASEMTAIGRGIDALAERLEGTVRGLRGRSEQSGASVRDLESSVGAVLLGSVSQTDTMNRVVATAESFARSTRDLVSSVSSLSSSSEQTTSSILATVATIEEVAGHADGLTMSVEDTAATTQEVVDSIKEIDRNVELLNEFVAETSESMSRMGKVIEQVERNAADSKAISELVAGNAEKGMTAVLHTIEGMDGIYGSVVQTRQVIESVGRKGQEIGLILNVIQEVTEQTNLLALNAAIIAAQAGEHGRGFGVVAEEFRQLAERTAASAKEIGNLIASFQSETGRAVQAMQEGMGRVEVGSERSREAGRMLKEILESARQSYARVSEIAEAARDQARCREVVGASVEKVRGMAAQIKKATAEQTLGSEQIMSAVENMREMSGHVKRATAEQTRGSRSVTHALGSVGSMIAGLHHAAAEQATSSDQVLKGLTAVSASLASNLAVAERLRQALATLRGSTEGIAAEIEGFTATR
jgi:methyl-accepting chemotaxis protein